jgi:hypothetical protein
MQRTQPTASPGLILVGGRLSVTWLRSVPVSAVALAASTPGDRRSMRGEPDHGQHVPWACQTVRRIDRVLSSVRLHGQALAGPHGCAGGVSHLAFRACAQAA